MLSELDYAGRAGSTRQLSFAFTGDSAVTPETPIQRVAWETEALGQPVSTHPLEAVAPQPGVVTLTALPATQGRYATIRGVRLPGWTGGKGFFLGDGHDFVTVVPAKELAETAWRKLWRPLQLSGWWRQDEWQGEWFQADKVILLDG
jgi:hypothetical protein